MDAEKQLRALENDLKALKANYPVAASKAKFYVSKSQTFTVIGEPQVRFRFAPQYGAGKTQLTTLYVSIKIGGVPAGFSPYVNLPQDGSGNVDVLVSFDQYSASTQYQVTIIASGTSPGTFSKIN